MYSNKQSKFEPTRVGFITGDVHQFVVHCLYLKKSNHKQNKNLRVTNNLLKINNKKYNMMNYTGINNIYLQQKI